MKANYGTLGVMGNVELFNCDGQNDPAKRTASIAKWAQDRCKATGVVTTSKVTDASPAGLYSRALQIDLLNQILQLLFFKIKFQSNRFGEQRLGKRSRSA